VMSMEDIAFLTLWLADEPIPSAGLSSEIVKNAPELLARAAAFERVAIQARGVDAPTSVGWFATAEVMDFDDSAAKGFKP
jgi:hypothetical protein